jgi:hypothetical protein
MSITLPKRQSLPRKPALPGGRAPFESLALPQPKVGQADHDQYGLARAWAGDMGQRVREWLSVAYEYLGFDKNKPPSGQGHFGSSGTIPEIAFMGGLLSRGLKPFINFEFQSEALGGRRFPGGAVLDFLVYVNGLRVGVRVESVFHASDFVFAGNAKVREDEAQRIRLESGGAVDRVINVNRQSDGYPLEGANDALADRDVDRVLEAV